MDFEAWTVDLKSLSARHECGFELDVEGNAKDPSAVNPGRFPAGLSGIEQVRLLRTGVEAIANAAKAQSLSRVKAPSYVPPKNKPQRPKLSLKKKSEPTDS